MPRPVDFSGRSDIQHYDKARADKEKMYNQKLIDLTNKYNAQKQNIQKLRGQAVGDSAKLLELDEFEQKLNDKYVQGKANLYTEYHPSDNRSVNKLANEQKRQEAASEVSTQSNGEKQQTVSADEKDTSSESDNTMSGIFDSLGNYFRSMNKSDAPGASNLRNQAKMHDTQAGEEQANAQQSQQIANRDYRGEAEKNAVASAATQNAQTVANLGNVSAGAAALERTVGTPDYNTHMNRQDEQREKAVEKQREAWGARQTAEEERQAAEAENNDKSNMDMYNSLARYLSMGAGGNNTDTTEQGATSTNPAPENTTPQPEDTNPTPENTTPQPEGTGTTPEDTNPTPESTGTTLEGTNPAPEAVTPPPESDNTEGTDINSNIKPNGTMDLDKLGVLEEASKLHDSTVSMHEQTFGEGAAEPEAVEPRGDDEVYQAINYLVRSGFFKKDVDLPENMTEDKADKVKELLQDAMLESGKHGDDAAYVGTAIRALYGLMTKARGILSEGGNIGDLLKDTDYINALTSDLNKNPGYEIVNIDAILDTLYQNKSKELIQIVADSIESAVRHYDELRTKYDEEQMNIREQQNKMYNQNHDGSFKTNITPTTTVVTNNNKPSAFINNDSGEANKPSEVGETSAPQPGTADYSTHSTWNDIYNSSTDDEKRAMNILRAQNPAAADRYERIISNNYDYYTDGLAQARADLSAITGDKGVMGLMGNFPNFKKQLHAVDDDIKSMDEHKMTAREYKAALARQSAKESDDAYKQFIERMPPDIAGMDYDSLYKAGINLDNLSKADFIKMFENTEPLEGETDYDKMLRILKAFPRVKLTENGPTSQWLNTLDGHPTGSDERMKNIIAGCWSRF